MIENRLNRRKKIDTSGCWIWTGSVSRHGYGRIRVNKKLRLVHRISAWFYLGFDIDSKKFVLHKCDNRQCFNPKHLYIGTQLDNMRDCSRRGRFNCRKGINNGRAKLTEEQVREIRRCLDVGMTQTWLAKTYKVPQNTIHKIKAGKAWSHVTP